MPRVAGEHDLDILLFTLFTLRGAMIHFQDMVDLNNFIIFASSLEHSFAEVFLDISFHIYDLYNFTCPRS